MQQLLPPLPALRPLLTLQQPPQDNVDTPLRAALRRLQAQGAACPLCGRLFTAEHALSLLHSKRLSEHEELDYLAGRRIPGEIRVLQAGLPGPLTKQRARAWWGVHLDTLPSRCMERLLSRGLKVGKRMHSPGDIARGKPRPQLAMVSYKGAGGGKCTDSTRCVPWFEVPDSDPPNSGGAASSWEGLEAPDGETWWPVCLLVWEADHVEFVAVTSTGCFVAVCIYQMGWPVPSGWWVTITPAQRWG